MSPAAIGDLIVVAYVFALGCLTYLWMGAAQRRLDQMERRIKGLYTCHPDERGDHASTTR